MSWLGVLVRLGRAGLGFNTSTTSVLACSAEHKAAKAAAEAQQEANKADAATAAAAAEGGGVAAASAVSPGAKAPVPAFPVKSVLSMTRAEARALGVPWMRMAQVRFTRVPHVLYR